MNTKYSLKSGFSLLVLLALFVGGCQSTPTQQSTGEFVDDAAIAAKVKTQLFQDPGTSGFQIDVKSFKGTVQLSGFVNTDSSKDRAGQIATKTEGVVSVKNDLIVKSGSAKSN